MSIFNHLGLYRRESRARNIPPQFEVLRRLPVSAESIALWGFLRSQIGIGSSARGYARLLRQAMPEATCHALSLPGRDGVDFQTDPFRVRARRNIVVLNPPELLNRNYYFPTDLMRNTSVIGYWAWELPHMPQDWLPAFDLVDEVWTCSSFAARAFQGATHKKVSILPHVVEGRPQMERSAARHRLGLGGEGDFIFLSVFDFASTLRRKNPLGVIAAFRQAFGDGPDGPRLVMKYHGAEQFLEDEVTLRAAAAACPRIHLLSGVFSEPDMKALFDAANCFVSLHRSEGFGLNIAEAMVAGLPVICTGYSGNMDFTTSRNALLVNWSPVELRPGDYFGWQGQSWAEPDLFHASAAMRFAVEHPQDAGKLGAQARADVSRLFSPQAISAQMMALLRASELPAHVNAGVWARLNARLRGDQGASAPRHGSGTGAGQDHMAGPHRPQILK